MERLPRSAATLGAAFALATLAAALPPASARDHLGWRRDALGQLVLRELPRGAPSDAVTPPGAGTLQRLPMPEPPGESAFDRALAHEREAVSRERAKRRAALEGHAEALRKVAERNRIESASAEAKRRAPRAERAGSAKKKTRTRSKHTNANHATHRAPPEPVAAPAGEADD